MVTIMQKVSSIVLGGASLSVEKNIKKINIYNILVSIGFMREEAIFFSSFHDLHSAKISRNVEYRIKNATYNLHQQNLLYILVHQPE